MYMTTARCAALLALGKQREHLARGIAFHEPLVWEREFGPGSVQLVNRRAGCREAYPTLLERREDGSYLWALSAADTAYAGYGECELRYLVGETVVKSESYRTLVRESVGEPGKPPEPPEQSYLDQVAAQGAAAVQAASRAEAQADRAEEAARRAEESKGAPELGNGLKWAGGKLAVDTADAVEQDNTKPVTSAAVHTQLGNIEALLAAI